MKQTIEGRVTRSSAGPCIKGINVRGVYAEHASHLRAMPRRYVPLPEEGLGKDFSFALVLSVR